MMEQPLIATYSLISESDKKLRFLLLEITLRCDFDFPPFCGEGFGIIDTEFYWIVPITKFSLISGIIFHRNRNR